MNVLRSNAGADGPPADVILTVPPQMEDLGPWGTLPVFCVEQIGTHLDVRSKEMLRTTSRGTYTTVNKLRMADYDEELESHKGLIDKAKAISNEEELSCNLEKIQGLHFPSLREAPLTEAAIRCSSINGLCVKGLSDILVTLGNSPSRFRVTVFCKLYDLIVRTSLANLEILRPRFVTSFKSLRDRDKIALASRFCNGFINGEAEIIAISLATETLLECHEKPSQLDLGRKIAKRSKEFESAYIFPIFAKHITWGGDISDDEIYLTSRWKACCAQLNSEKTRQMFDNNRGICTLI